MRSEWNIMWARTMSADKRPLLRRKTILHLVRAKKLPFPLPLPIFQKGAKIRDFHLELYLTFADGTETLAEKPWQSLHRMEIHILIPFMETERMAFACKRG